MGPVIDVMLSEMLDAFPAISVLAALMFAFIFLIWRNTKIQFDRLYTGIYKIVANEHMGYGEKRAQLAKFAEPLNDFLHIEYLFDECVTLYMYVHDVSEAQAASDVLDARLLWRLNHPSYHS